MRGRTMMGSQSHNRTPQGQAGSQGGQRLRMANPFYFGAALWTIALVAYGLAWSDLCKPLDGGLLSLLLLLIISFLALGFVFRNLLYVSANSVSDPERMKGLTVLICAVMLAGMAYQRYVPLVNVIQGRAYNATEIGIPLLGTICTALALYQSFRLSFAYQITRSRTALVQLGAIIAVLVLAVQRQNIMVCIVGALLAIWTCRKRTGHTSALRQCGLLLALIVVALVLLFVFGALGNARYGTWSWDDSSMIAALGYVNGGWPAWLPKEYLWFYVYLVTPIANLNNNVFSVMPQDNLRLLFWLLVPSSMGKYFLPQGLGPFLVQPTLTVCTSYVNSYLVAGYDGMLLFMTLQQLLIAVVAAFAVRERGSAKFAALSAVVYYVGLTIFDNPSTYLITAYLSLVVIAHSLWSSWRRGRLLSVDHE